MRTEQDLIEALRNAASGAPAPVDLDRLLAVRRRRRTRRRYQSALAAAGVVAVALGGTAVVRGGDRTDEVRPMASAVPSAADPSPADRPTLPKERARPAREVWPEAVSTFPKKAADGFKYRPVTALSPTEILLTAEASFEKAGRLEVYDTRTGEARVLATMTPGGKGYYVQNVEPGRDYIAWYGTTPNDDRKWADFWVVPRQGGEPIRVGEVTGDLALVDRIGVTGDHIVWSPKSGGVYRMPISGGPPEKVAGTDGLWLASWPWARDVLGDAGPDEEQRNRNQTLLVDLETGARRSITAPSGVTGLRCATEWCVGNSDGSDGNVFAMRPDGTEGKQLPGRAYMPEIHGGHFVQLRERHHALYDLNTGKVAGVSAITKDGAGGSYGRGVSSSPTLVFYWNAGEIKAKRTCVPMREEDRKTMASAGATPSPGATTCMTEFIDLGDKYDVLNLAAVPDAG
ncbi:hypothetical protein [Microtetraspora sp. NBRC 16547]|uniref:hypothetical protein n=1 Tax=Microtetraspora sp. NBRC 16547 TaxID=3030993 RepID=UPI0024A49141|nr:hypothetical protein [Microtetraspora sp. NBRC 16547]GLX00582.1 hypothetical protein Misp02_46680 [Microtetraspora sp. NBRC 16547]